MDRAGHPALLVAAGLLLARPTRRRTASPRRDGVRRRAADQRRRQRHREFGVRRAKATASLRSAAAPTCRSPAGAARVDLTGKTVIPALIDAHSHIGYMRNLTSGPQNYTRENILDHMHKLRLFRRRRQHGDGLRFRRAAVPAARRDRGRKASARGALPHRRPRARADRRDQAQQHAALGASGHDRGRRTAGGRGPGRQRREDGQDLGRYPGRNDQEAHAAALRGDHRRGAQAQDAGRGPCHGPRRRQGADARRDGRFRAHGRRRRRRADGVAEGQAEHVLHARARRAAAPDACALDRSAAHAGERHRVARADQAIAASGWRSRRRLRTRPGPGCRAASRALQRPACASASAPTAAGSRATSSSAGPCTPSSRTWWRPG